MPNCAVCDVELAKGDGVNVTGVFLRKAVEGGLRPPLGKLRRSAERVAKTEEGIQQTEAKFEKQWVEFFVGQPTGSHLLCASCNSKASDAFAKAY